MKKNENRSFEEIMGGLPEKIRCRLKKDLMIYGNSYLEFQLKVISPTDIVKNVDDMAKKGKGKAQKKAEKKPAEEAKAETQEPETSTEENPAVGEEAD